KSTPLISGRFTSNSTTSGFQKPRKSRHSAAVWATPTTRAIPDPSMRPFNPSVRILWSSTMPTLIISSIFVKFQFHMCFGPLPGGVDFHFAHESRYPLTDVPQSHTFMRCLWVKPPSIVLTGKGYAVVLLDQSNVDLAGLRVFEGIVDQFVDAAVYHDLHFTGQPGLIPKVVEVGVGDGGAEIRERDLQAMAEQGFRHHMMCHPAEFLYGIVQHVQGLPETGNVHFLKDGIPLDLWQVEFDQGQHAAQSIVQVLGQTGAFRGLPVQGRLYG